jgi:hypothetical protein
MKIIKVLVISLVSLAIIVGCESKSNMIENSKSAKKVKLSQKSINIKIESNWLNNYSIHDTFIFDSVTYLYCYNNQRHEIDIFDLSNENAHRKIKLDSEGVNSVNRVYKLKVLSEDSILILDAIKLILLNSNGTIKKNISLNYFSKKSDDRDEGYFLNYNGAEISVLNDDGDIVLHYIDYKIRGNNNSENYAYSPVFGIVNIKDNSFTLLPPAYSDQIILRKGNVDERMPNMHIHDSILYYSWPMESDIYSYSFRSGEIKKSGGKSNFSNNLENYSRNKEIPSRLTETWFNSIKNISNTELFIRTHWGSQTALNIDNRMNTSYSKPGYFMIFDSKLSVIQEVLIDEEYWLEDSFIVPNGIGFWQKDIFKNSEDSLNILVYEINEIL